METVYRRYAEQGFSNWWLLLAPALWAVLLVLAFWPTIMANHHEPGVRHPVQTQMDIPLCYQVEGLPEGYCYYLNNKETAP
jgi:hypothetical protein